MAIQGTQVPIYTNTHYFCIFLIFQKKNYVKKNKTKLKTNEHTRYKDTKHKTRLTQKQESKTNKQDMQARGEIK